MANKFVPIVSLAAAAIGGSAYWALSGNESQVSALNANIQDQNASIVADKWQWRNFIGTRQESDAGENSAADKPRSRDSIPYDAVEVYKVLQTIKLGQDGRLVPDQTALKALEKGFDDLGPDLSPEAMAGLQNLIRKGLPGPAGEEAAQILENYFRFRVAEAGFSEQLANQLPAAEHQKELMQLRRNYLGQEVADRLFAVEDTQARHMLAVLAIQKNADLTAEEKQIQQATLQEQLNNRLVALGQLKPEELAAEKVGRLREQGASSADIYAARQAIVGTEGARQLADADREEAQWQGRFNGYWQARRYVTQAGYDEVERERQIEQLLNQYFSPEERERARVTSFEWQARDTT